MNPHLTVRPPRYKPEYIKANRMGPKRILEAKERDRVMFMLMLDRARGFSPKGRGQ